MKEFCRKLSIGFTLVAGLTAQAQNKATPTKVTEEAKKEAANFIVDQILPAFGGKNAISFKSYPKIGGSSFASLHDPQDPSSVKKWRHSLEKCGIHLELNQIKAIQHPFVEIPTYLNASAEIGGKRSLQIEANCLGMKRKSSYLNELEVHIRLYFLNEKQEEVPYPLVVKALDQDLVDLDFYGSEVRVILHAIPQKLLVSEDSFIAYQPDYENFLLKDDVYQIPMRLWHEREELPVSNPMLAALNLDEFFKVMQVPAFVDTKENSKNQTPDPVVMEHLIRAHLFDVHRSVIIKSDHKFAQTINVANERQKVIFYAHADYYQLSDKTGRNLQQIKYETTDQRRK